MNLNESIKLKACITLLQARALAVKAGKAVSFPTLINWVATHSLGHQPAGKGGKWYIFKDDFIKFISGVENGKNIKITDKEHCKSSCDKKPEGCGGRRTK